MLDLRGQKVIFREEERVKTKNRRLVTALDFEFLASGKGLRQATIDECFQSVNVQHFSVTSTGTPAGVVEMRGKTVLDYARTDTVFRQCFRWCSKAKRTSQPDNEQLLIINEERKRFSAFSKLNNSITQEQETKNIKPTNFKFGAIVVVLLFVNLSTTFGQRKVRYQDNYDAKNTHFGFLIGVGQTNYGIKTNRTFLQPINTALDGIVSPPSYFLRLGGLMNVKLNDHFDFRILPAVSIYSRSLILSDTLSATTDLVSQRDKAWLELPIALKYKSERRGNIRMYMFGGFRYGKETNVINFINRAATPNIVETKASDFSVEYGIGLEAFLRYFKLTPELHFSHGLANSLRPTVSNAINTNQLIERMNTHTVTLVFMFE